MTNHQLSRLENLLQLIAIGILAIITQLLVIAWLLSELP